MRSTVRIDDDLLEALKQRADAQGTSMTRALNAVLRTGLQVREQAADVQPFRQRTLRLGLGFANMDKALALADELADEATIRKIDMRR